MKRAFIFPAGLFLLLLSLCGCSEDKMRNQKDLIAQVNQTVLTRKQLAEQIGSGRSGADSARLADHFINHWIEEELLYEKALQNLSDMQEIDRLVEDYKRQLIVFEYQKKLVNERLKDEISEEELQSFYQSHRTNFTLNKPIIKGIFLKLPIDAPQRKVVKKCMENISAESLEKIEKYSLQNAMVYEYFLDRWVPVEELMENIPYQITQENRYLKENKILDVSEGDYGYCLSIQEYIPSGELQPFDYARTRNQEMLSNQKKKSFIRSLGKELYEKALREDKVKIYKESSDS